LVLVQERIPEAFESKTLIEKLQYLLDSDHTPTKEDKSVETKLNMVDKCDYLKFERKYRLQNYNRRYSVLFILFVTKSPWI